jgi:ParB family chromosome partitioning protein
MKDEVITIPIEQIRILNPRYRDRKKFAHIVQSIRNVGLKKPIQVSLRSSDELEGTGYDLVCGQGRIEAFQALGYKNIPALVVEVSREERLLRSLVENLARRRTSPLELLSEIERLKGHGYSNVEIGRKLDIDDSTVGGLIALAGAGEKRLITAAMRGTIPLNVAIDIARTDSMEAQRELLWAYENKKLNNVSLRAVKRLMEQRRLFGKGGGPARKGEGERAHERAASLVATYQRERHRQSMLIKKAKVCEAKRIFVETAFIRLLADENFVILLRAEGLETMPKSLWLKVATTTMEAA